MVNVEFSEDSIVMPSYSATFGITKDYEISGKFVSFDQLGIYEDVGLGKLWRRGGLISCVVKGGHLSMKNLPNWFRMSSLLDNYKPNFFVGSHYTMKWIYQESARVLLQNLPKGLVCQNEFPQEMLKI
jgi:hypothetical protein